MPKRWDKCVCKVPERERAFQEHKASVLQLPLGRVSECGELHQLLAALESSQWANSVGLFISILQTPCILQLMSSQPVFEPQWGWPSKSTVLQPHCHPRVCVCVLPHAHSHMCRYTHTLLLPTKAIIFWEKQHKTHCQVGSKKSNLP